MRGDPETLCIAEGRVETHAIRPGLTLVLSDVRVHQHYEATSMMSPRFSAIVMLQGHAQTRIDRHDDVRLAAHSGVSALYGDTVAMTGIHAPGQRLRSINLSLSDPDGAGDDQTSEMIWKALRSPSLRLRRWQVQGHLLQAIEHLLDCGWDGPLQAMLREGVGTQLLAHALATLEQRAPADSTVSERDRQLLERVRERLYSAPGEEHTLDELARLACMSPSTLRAKFRRPTSARSSAGCANGGWKWRANNWPKGAACNRRRISSVTATPPTSPRRSASATASLPAN